MLQYAQQGSDSEIMVHGNNATDGTIWSYLLHHNMAPALTYLLKPHLFERSNRLTTQMPYASQAFTTASKVVSKGRLVSGTGNSSR